MELFMETGAPPVQGDSKECNATDLISSAGDWITDSISGLPAPVRKNAWKAFGQLCTAAIQYPVAILEGAAKEKNAETAARIKLIEKSAEQISANLNVDPTFGVLAAQKYARKIVREQINIERVSRLAAEELRREPTIDSKAGEELIDEDWLSSFEREARDKSSEEMQLLFGRILAGEIKCPKTFSIHTVRTIGQLDSHVAELFVKFCSICITLGFEDRLIDVRVLAIDKTAGANGLKDFGLNYSNLTLLQEHGLVSASLDSHASYSASVTPDGQPPVVPIKYVGKLWGFRPHSVADNASISVVRGVSLTKVGRELSRIVDIEPNAAYSNLLFNKFSTLGYEMIQV
jgi:hypothetical protein